MKKFLRNPIIKYTDEKSYFRLLSILAPLLNFLSGITFDLHAPSLPAIASYFAAPISAAKNTITLSLFGFAIGCILFGTLLDIFGRRAIILLALLLYTLASFGALACNTIDGLLFVRFVQGFSVACVSIGCRTIIIDTFSGHAFKVALLYTSLAFGIGPIIAPFIGGFLQYHFGWQANFIAYGLVSFILLIVFALYISESMKENITPFSFRNMWNDYLTVMKNRSFAPGAFISGLSQIQLLVYTTIGAFLIENVLHFSAITYGNSALVISSGYLFGTLTNRLLIKHYSVYSLIKLGFIFLFIGVLSQIIFALFYQLTLFAIILPITLIGFSNGFIFINVLSCCLRLSTRAGIATALFTSAVMIVATIGTNILSHIEANNVTYLAIIFGATAVFQVTVFYLFFRKSAQAML